MKLLYCPNCDDVFRLTKKLRTCECGEVSGRYLSDGLHAEYNNGIPLGFGNRSFVTALNHQPVQGLGTDFTAFVIPKQCPTMKKVKEFS